MVSLVCLDGALWIGNKKFDGSRRVVGALCEIAVLKLVLLSTA